MSITIYNVVQHILKKSDTDSITMEDTNILGLPFFGNCQYCEETVASGNMYPGKNGYVMCRGCVENSKSGGFENVEEFIKHTFPNFKNCFVLNRDSVGVYGIHVVYANEDIILLDSDDSLDYYFSNTKKIHHKDSNVEFSLNYDEDKKFWIFSNVREFNEDDYQGHISREDWFNGDPEGED